MNINQIINGDDEDDIDDENEGAVVIENDDDEEDGKKKAKDNATEDDDEAVEEEERPGRAVAKEGDEHLTDEERREKRRADRKRQKERRRLAAAHDKQTIASLQEALAQTNRRLQQLESGRAGDEEAKVDAALRGAQNRIELLKATIKKANEEGDSDLLSKATDELVDVKADLRAIEGFKVGIQEAKKKERDTETKPSDDQNETVRRRQEVIVSNVRRFAARHPWYNIEGDDEDSKAVRAIDRQVAAEGYTPESSAYWEELEERIKEEMPQRFNKNGQQQRNDSKNGKRGAPNMGGGSGRGNGGGSGGDSFVLSKQRVEAMKEAGIWDDPERKKRAIAQFKKFDREQKEARN